MVIVVTLTAAAVAVWRAPGTSPSMRSALRVGFAELLVGLGIGVVDRRVEERGDPISLSQHVPTPDVTVDQGGALWLLQDLPKPPG